MCQCARVRSIFGEGAGWLGAGRCHDSDGGRLGAGADSAEGRARAARCAPDISSLARAGRWHGSRVAGEQVGSGGASEGGRSLTHYLGWKCRPAGGAGAARGGAGSLADAIPSPRLTASQGGGPAVGGEPAERLETRRQAGDRSRTQMPRSTRGLAGSRHCKRRRGTAVPIGTQMSVPIGTQGKSDCRLLTT